MRKQLKTFKKEKTKNVITPEVEEREEQLPVRIQMQAIETTKSIAVTTQLERMGYSELANEIKSQQLNCGLKSLAPLMTRLELIEKQIDQVLASGAPIEMSELRAILKLTADAAKTRAQALLLPYGAISPRSLARGDVPKVGAAIAVGIGTGVSPRPK